MCVSMGCGLCISSVNLEGSIRWIKSFLLDRETSLTLNCKISNMKPVHTSIPQGSPISPILFLFFNAPLIEDCASSSSSSSYHYVREA